MSGGPYVLVDIATKRPVAIGDTRESIRINDALRWQCTVLAIEAPKLGEPHGRVLIRYSDGTETTVRPSYIAAEFVETANVQDNEGGDA